VLRKPNPYNIVFSSQIDITKKVYYKMNVQSKNKITLLNEHLELAISFSPIYIFLEFTNYEKIQLSVKM